MSGHSKWATTKHKKANIDAKRGKLFAKLIKNIEVAAKLGGGDLNGNPTLFDAVQKAKKSSVPNDNITRAVKRGSGADSESVNYESLMYEGYASGGVAVLVECLTDNKNRAAGDVRSAFTKAGGQLADPGSVAFQFARKGLIAVPKEGTTEDDVFEAVMDFAEDVDSSDEDLFEIVTEPNNLVPAREALQAAGIDYESADSVFYPSSQIDLNEEAAKKVVDLIDKLEDLDDVQEVYTNMA
jgi:YebC/PmpR family DNA-binding regulatory protein